MSKSDDFFDPDRAVHPTLRKWLAARDRAGAGSATLQVKRERDALMYLPARFVFKVGRTSDTALWSDDLNIELIRAGVRVKSLDNEMERFGLTLRQLFKPTEIVYGDGFFNAVLIELLREGPFADHEGLKAALADIHENRPYTHGRSYVACRSAIRDTIARCGAMLVEQLKYSRKQAQDILAGALVYFLDERYSITNRKMLGFG